MDLSKLNNEQQKAVTTTDGPVLVIAGAGTGKTSVLTHRITYLLESLSADPSRILALTFTNKAAEEMKTRINKMIKTVNLPWIRTYHSTCLKILKEDIDKLGWNNNFSIIDEEDQLSLVKSIIKNHELKLKTNHKKIVRCIGEIKLNDLNTSGLSFNDIAKHLELLDETEAKSVMSIFDTYNKQLKLSNQLDFSDLINFVNILFKKNEEVRKKWEKKFDYILIDEFQDTSYKQFEIIKAIVGVNNNIFAVGDPNQTIYTWRGAYPEIFDDFYRQFKNTQIIKLAHNYRSPQDILKAANQLIVNNENNFKNELIPIITSKAKVKIFKADYIEQEANFVCSTINKLVKNNQFSYQQILILYRANYCTRSLEEKLVSHQIPYVIFGSINFYQRKEIKDLLSYLKLLYKPDDLAAMRIINVPHRAIGINTIDKINKWATENNITFVDALNRLEDEPSINKATKTKIYTFLQQIKTLKQTIEQKGWEHAISSIVEHFKYIDWLKQNEIDVEDRIQNIDELTKAMLNYKLENPNSTPIDFINEVNLYTSAEKTKLSSKPCVYLMTVHMAKGKEHDVVFIYNFNEGVIPSPNATIDQTGIEEERRIAYVAMTRAKKELYITCTKNNMFGYSKFFQRISPSRFLNEIHTYEEVYQNVSSTSNKDLDWYDSKQDNINSLQPQPIDLSKIYTNNYQYKIGDVVVHTTFGSGVVVNVQDDTIDVIFKPPYRKKTLSAKHNALKRVIS